MQYLRAIAYVFFFFFLAFCSLVEVNCDQVHLDSINNYSNSTNSSTPLIPLEYCVMAAPSKGGIDPIYQISAPFMPQPPLTNGTCLISHPSYANLSCCSQAQTETLLQNMILANTMFGRCPSCIYNLYTLWCGFTCDPLQGNFVQITKTHSSGGETYVKGATFTLDPTFALNLYDSCRDVKIDGGVSMSIEFPTYEEFFSFMGGNNPAFPIEFLYSETNSYSANVVPCSESCSCNNCRDSCVTPPDLPSMTSTLPTTHFFNRVWPQLSVWLLVGFMIFLLSFFFGMNVVFAVGSIRERMRLFSHIQTVTIVFTVTMVLLVTSTIISIFIPWPKSSSKCYYHMPLSTTWNCVTAWLIIADVLICFLGLAIIAYMHHKQKNLHRRMVEANNISSSRMTGYATPPLHAMSDIDIMSSPYYTPQGYVQRIFYTLGWGMAKRPALVVFTALVITALCGMGMMNLQIETDPVKLWVSPTSRAAQDKAYFDEHFGPFFRVEQLIILPSNPTLYPLLGVEVLSTIFEIETAIRNIEVPVPDGNYFIGEGGSFADHSVITIDDLCFKPVVGKGCIVESVSGFWQNNITTLLSSEPNPVSHIEYCLNAKMLQNNCMDMIGTPVQPPVVFGGFFVNETNGLANYTTSTALVTTFLLNNYDNITIYAEAWEAEFLRIVAMDWPYITIAYSAERSVQDELTRESSTDISTIIVSYLVMFLYVSLALGRIFPLPKFSKLAKLFVRTRFTLGMSGVLVVICSIVISAGLCSAMGIKATLIISEVIPFLVLAIGVDNIFILVNTFENIKSSSSYELHSDYIAHTLGLAMSKSGPSMALASISESLAFLLGALTKMPAVQAFSYYAAVAVFFDFLLQITAFAALLSLDAKRIESKRVDCLPCVKISPTTLEEEGESKETITPLIEINKSQTRHKEDGLLKSLVRRYYAPFVLHPITKVVVIVVFVAMFLAGLNFSFQLQLGLDQRVALPKNSYLQAYFTDLTEYLAVGPPLYVVIRDGYDYSSFQAQNKICTVGGCNNNSLVNVYDGAPYIAQNTYSWLDDYLAWTQTPLCCQYNPETLSRCPYDNGGVCSYCFPPSTNGRPPPDEFYSYIPWFLTSTVDVNNCPLTGMAYVSDMDITGGSNNVSGVNNVVVEATRIRMYHSVLKTQDDYINAMKTAYWIADHSDLDVFPYSIFYVYFEQYLYIREIALMDILFALGGVLLVTFLILFNPLVSILVVICVGMVVVDLMGIMFLWSVNLNAVSVVNIVMAVGIAIEFCVHIAHSFVNSQNMRSPPSSVVNSHNNSNNNSGEESTETFIIEEQQNSERRKKRVFVALVDMGSSVLSGIAVTKFLGVVVLGFSKSEIFEVYYFRMYISIVILGALHGLLLLPVLLTIFNTDKFSLRGLCKPMFVNKN